MKKLESIWTAAVQAEGRTARFAKPAGVLLALGIAGATALWNVSGGPLCNLNDIGGWGNRLIFLVMAAAAEALVLMTAAVWHRGGIARLLLRQGMLALTFVMSLLAINQKTYFYVQQVQPLVRAMDEGGLGAMAGYSLLSVPMRTLLYLVTRGPVYDMYPAKLFAIVCFQMLCLTLLRLTEEEMPGGQGDALLALCLILPQGFLSAACAAQPESAALLLLAAAWMTRRRRIAPAVCFALACALSGLCLFAVPWMLKEKKEKERLRFAGVSLLVWLLAMLPALLAGVPAREALASPFAAILGVPPYASGSPNLMGLFPRAAVSEMPEYFLLQRVPALDLETNATPFYTARHFELLMRGLALTGLGGICCSLAWCEKKKIGGPQGALLLIVSVLFWTPGASMAAWLAADLLCMAAILHSREMRLPACLILFATAAGCCYPVTEETLLRPAFASMLILIALGMLAGIFPTPGRKEETHG